MPPTGPRPADVASGRAAIQLRFIPRTTLSASLLKVDDVAGDNHPMDSAELARISAAFVKAIAEAQTLADSGEFGAELQDLLRHARELLALAFEELDSGDPGRGEYARGLATSMGLKLEGLEALLDTSTRH